ncbi:MAG: NAD(+)/NADH kinase [Verrucomicrobiota bacterium]
MAKTPRLGIIANPKKQGASALLKDLTERFTREDIDFVLEAKTAEILGDGVGISSIEEFADACDLMIVLGGDGTILWMLRHLGQKIKPIAAINTGTLGFMTCATSEESEQLVRSIKENTLQVTNRTVIKTEVRTAKAFLSNHVALNEVTLGRSNNSRVVHVEATVDGLFANRYTGDGVIVATPTGSTAYSLSAGGPIVFPGADVFILTPICPHALANRPLVLGADSKIELRVPEQRDDLSMMVDGEQVEEICDETFITIQRAPFYLPLVSLPGQNFYGVLHQKLGWTGSNL